MNNIVFEIIPIEARFLNPLKNFEEVTHVIEIRKDPLLGDTSIFNPFFREKAKTYFGQNDPQLIETLVRESAKTCIFCCDKIDRIASPFSYDLIPEGKVRSGDAVLFSNLFPLGTYHAVISMCANHFLKLSEFTPGIISDSFLASRGFLRSVYEKDPSAAFININMNYLFPAGASLVHPHLQMLVTPVALSYQARLSGACRDYHGRTGRAYHADLIRAERERAERYVKQEGAWHWMASFSPAGSNEIIAVHESEGDIVRLDEQDLRDLSSGISKVLAFFEELGHLSFNFTLFSERRSDGDSGSRCLVKVMNRQNVYPNYRNDDFFLQKVLQSEVIIITPEELASRLKGYFA